LKTGILLEFQVNMLMKGEKNQNRYFYFIQQKYKKKREGIS